VLENNVVAVYSFNGFYFRYYVKEKYFDSTIVIGLQRKEYVVKIIYGRFPVGDSYGSFYVLEPIAEKMIFSK
jgi:hypothetical protein